MQPMAEDVEFLEHFGVKGMRWGVRRKTSGSERKAGRRELRETAKTARQILKKANKAGTPEERKALAQRYKKEVFDRINSPAWKKAYQDANTMGKGEMATHVLLAGPFAALTIPSVKKQYAVRQSVGADSELGVAKAVLAQIRDIDN